MSKCTLKCEYLIGNKVWKHARNTNTRVPQVTVWFGMLTHLLRCTFGTTLNIFAEVLENKETIYVRPIVVFVLFLVSFQNQVVPWEMQCIHMLHISLMESVPSHHDLFRVQNAIPRPVLSAWFGRLFEYHLYNIFPKSMSFTSAFKCSASI